MAKVRNLFGQAHCLSRFFVALYVFLTTSVVQLHAQIIEGTVVDDSNEPLVGVTVAAGKKASVGATTDVNGKFRLNVSGQKYPLHLTFRYVGSDPYELNVYDDEMTDVGTIIMRTDRFSLNDVVVVGYGESLRQKLVGSVSKVKGDAVVNATQESPVLALQGNAAGVYVTQGSGVPGGGSSSILIRGKKTISTSTNYNKPLYIVDGVPFNTNAENPVGYTSTGVFGLADALAFINPSDIESMEILKDADATAIYGTRGTNGVVLITTKKGKAGKTKVNFSASTTASWVPKRLDFLSTEDYLDIRRKALEADVAAGVYPNGYNEADFPDLFLWDQHTDYDWQEQMIGKTAWGTDIQASVSGGNNTTSFLVSGSYYNSGTVSFGDDNYTRITGNANVVHNSTDGHLRLEASAKVSRLSQEAGVSDAPFSYLNTAPNRPLWDSEGKPYYVPDNKDDSSPTSMSEYAGTNYSNSFITNFSGSYKIWKGLSAKLSLGYEYSGSNQQNLYYRNYYNPYDNTQYAFARYYSLNTSVLNVEPQINYNTKLFGGDADFMLGGTYNSSEYRYLYMMGKDYPADIFLENASSAGTINYHSNPRVQTKLSSFFMRVKYDYDNRYLFNAVLRRDGSSRFGPGNRFGTFYSLGGGWIFSNEKFFKQSKLASWLSYGKIRMSYGKTGNDNVADYAYITKYTTSQYPYEGNVGIIPSNLANDNLHWETTKKFDIGMELGFLNDRILANISYYDYRSKDLLWNQKLSEQSGFTSITSNLNAVIQNKGWEFEINTRNISKPNFKWTTSFNISIPRNKLLKYDGLENSAYAKSYKIGESINVVRCYRYTGVDPETGCPTVEDVNGDGKINSTNDYQIIGTTDPDFYGGLSNTFTYKNFQFDVLFYFKRKPLQTGYFWRFYDSIGAQANITYDMATNYWKGPGDTTAKYPGLTTTRNSNIGYAYFYYMSYSDMAYSNASYIKLQNLKLAYNFPRKTIRSLGMSALQLYVQGKNLFTITNYDGYDPETGDASIPQLRQFTMGVNVTF